MYAPSWFPSAVALSKPNKSQLDAKALQVLIYGFLFFNQLLTTTLHTTLVALAQ
jgi:hypothetical protein